MSIAQLAKAINKQATLRVDDFDIAVTIYDVKQSFGHVRYYVSPVQGSGSAWVDESRITGIGGTND